jgi:hypothetical protein
MAAALIRTARPILVAGSSPLCIFRSTVRVLILRYWDKSFFEFHGLSFG